MFSKKFFWFCLALVCWQAYADYRGVVLFNSLGMGGPRRYGPGYYNHK